MNFLYILILIAGVGYIVFNIFLSSGGQAKFKSDLPKTEQAIFKRKWVILTCFSILCLLILVLLIAFIRSFWL